MSDKKDKRLSWDETYREIAREREDWSDLDMTIADGLGRNASQRPGERNGVARGGQSGDA